MVFGSGSKQQQQLHAPVMTPLDQARARDKALARQIEGIMREIDTLVLDEEREKKERSWTRNSMIVSTVFVFGGAYVTREGYRSAHPLWSPIRRLTKNNALCKIISPLTMTGMGIVGLGLMQAPDYYRQYEAAGSRLAKVEKTLKDRQAQRDELLEVVKVNAGVKAPAAPADTAAPS
jgi:hypothetical protein